MPEQCPPTTGVECETYDLVGDQDVLVGAIEVCNDADTLYVDFSTTGDWQLGQTHLAVSTDPPSSGAWGAWLTPSGNPTPGKFPYSSETCYEIDLDEIEGQDTAAPQDSTPLYIAAHAEVTHPVDSGELLANGSFEKPEVMHAAGWNIFDNGTMGLAWNVEWAQSYTGQPDPAHIELHEPGAGTEIPSGWTAQDGDQYTELDSDWDGPGSAPGEEASVIISQMVDTTGYDSCTLEYYYSPRPGHDDNQIEVFWDDAKVDTQSASGTGRGSTYWTKATVQLEGGAEKKLEFEETGEPDSFGMFLDNVSVVCTTIEETAWGGILARPIYLSEENRPNTGQSRIYSVSLDDDTGHANLSQLVDFEQFAQAHIAHAADQQIIYAIEKSSGELILYDVFAGTETRKTIAGAPGGVVLAATAPDGTLYFARQSNNKLYYVDDPTGSPTAVEVGNTGINVSGADLAFSADGTLYLWSNASGDNGLHTVNPTTGAATAIYTDNSLPSLTGLAFRQGGFGELVGSEANSTSIHVIDTTTGMLGNTFTMYVGDSIHTHPFGDMTMGVFGGAAVDLGIPFPDARNWATYFVYTLQPVN